MRNPTIANWTASAATLIVVGAFVLSEAVCHLLSMFPGSSLLWFLHLEVFQVFGRVTVSRTPYIFLHHPHAIWVGLAVMGLVLLAAVTSNRLFALAMAHFSFAIAVPLAISHLRKGAGSSALASLSPPTELETLDTVLAVVMIVATGVGLVLSHWSYLTLVKARVRDSRH